MFRRIENPGFQAYSALLVGVICRNGVHLHVLISDWPHLGLHYFAFVIYINSLHDLYGYMGSTFSVLVFVTLSSKLQRLLTSTLTDFGVQKSDAA